MAEDEVWLNKPGTVEPAKSRRQLNSLFTNEPAPSTVQYRTKSATSNRPSVSRLMDDLHEGDVGDEFHEPRDFTKSTRQVSENGVILEEGASQRSISSQNQAGIVDEVVKTGQLTWATGVFIPCLLNIWGVIMFLRIGFVVGQAGLWLGSLIIVGANVVTFVTALSLCAICTNGEVKGGGAYYLISRALGPLYGGTIGLLFYIAQAVATSMYLIGFAESVQDLLAKNDIDPFTGTQLNDIRVISIGTCVLLLCMALVGIGWYAKCQIGLLFVLVVAMVSVYVGVFFPKIPSASANEQAGFVPLKYRNAEAAFQNDPNLPSITQNFFTVFSVFFPAATGIMAGANLSGDIDDPSVAIPKGTLRAIFLTFWSYLALLWLIGCAGVLCADKIGEDYCPPGGVSTEEWAKAADENNTIPYGGLLYNKLIMENMSLWGPLVYVGVFAATLSSALASLVGAPRILQSVAKDDLFPFECFRYFAKERESDGEPVRAYFLSFAVAAACCGIGALDAIAPIISNFFMIAYALTNYACFAASMSETPGWRPSFKYYNKWLSLFGALLCVVVMFMMDWIMSLVTFLLAGIVFRYLMYVDPAVNWGPAGEARKYITALNAMESLQLLTKDHVKNFRPQFLVMLGEPEERIHLAKFASLLQKGRGVSMYANVILSKLPKPSSSDKQYKPLSDKEKSPSLQEIDLESGQEKPDTPRSRTDSMGYDSDLGPEDNFHTDPAFVLSEDMKNVRRKRAQMDQFLHDKKHWTKRCPGVFGEAITAASVASGAKRLLQSSGIGRMRPNTLMIGYKENWQNAPASKVRAYEDILRTTLASRFGLVVLRDDDRVFDLEVRVPKRGATALKCVQEQRCLGCLCCSATTQDQAQDFSKETTHSFSKVQPVLPTSLPGKLIDVWWWADDGGLTMLLPHLLNTTRNFKDHTLRVFPAIVNSSQDNNPENLIGNQAVLVRLLSKFRINAEVPESLVAREDQPSAKTYAKFQEVYGQPLDSIEKEEIKAKTLNLLILHELMNEHYNKERTLNKEHASVVFIVAPTPDTGLQVRLYMTWLHFLTEGLPPTVIMRGNGDDVLTFFS